MQISDELKLEIDKKISNISINDLKRHSSLLSAQYKEIGLRGNEPLVSDYQKLAYISVRMPATYATIVQTLRELSNRTPSIYIENALDVGAGPGTGLWALREAFSPSLKKVTLLEKDPGFIRLGKELYGNRTGIEVKWAGCDASMAESFLSHDLVLASFALGEFQEPDWRKTLLSMWQATRKFLIIIEPGTPRGFGMIRKMREILLEQGGHLAAPCPHSQTCPMQGSDWCHFAARVERTSIHRQIKNATMNYEDEKFCYLIFSREKLMEYPSRILMRPQKNNGYVNLKLCSSKGVENITISRKSKDDYRRARKSEWGDTL
ncbi:MAG: small ribosomal subunit Rsm22 family protein [Parachlamydiales bacterium]